MMMVKEVRVHLNRSYFVHNEVLDTFESLNIHNKLARVIIEHTARTKHHDVSYVSVHGSLIKFTSTASAASLSMTSDSGHC